MMSQTPLSASAISATQIGPIVTISTASGTTTDRSQTLTGTFSDGCAPAPAGQTVEIDDDGSVLGTAVVANGTWSSEVLLSDLGTNTLTATATDPDGRVGISSPSTFTLDTVLSPPQAGSATPEPLRSMSLAHNATGSAAGGRDIFVFTPHPGHAVIDGFSVSGDGIDRLSFSSHSFAGLADVLRHTSMSGSDAVIHLAPHDSVTLVGVSKAELRASPGAFQFHV